MLATLKLDYLEDNRDYAIWDWIYEFPKAEVEQYEISAGNMMVYGEGGKRITRFHTGEFHQPCLGISMQECYSI